MGRDSGEGRFHVKAYPRSTMEYSSAGCAEAVVERRSGDVVCRRIRDSEPRYVYVELTRACPRASRATNHGNPSEKRMSAYLLLK